MMTFPHDPPMSAKSEPKTEIKVVVEIPGYCFEGDSDFFSNSPLGSIVALLTTDAGEGILNPASGDSGNCGDGVDNDNGGQSDQG